MNNDLEKNILNTLLDKYENSKLSKGGTLINRFIKLTPNDKVLSSYTFFDSYKYVDNNDAVIKKLENLGFISATFKNDAFKSLTLNIDNVDKIYSYLKRNNPKDELDKIKNIISKYSFDNFLDLFIEYVSNYLKEKYDFPRIYFNNSNQLELILFTFKKILSLSSEIKKRDFSSKYLQDSKLFETIENKIVKIIRDFDGNIYDSDDDVLASYNIVKNSSYALIKNNLIIKINDSIIDLNKFGFELSLSDEMIENLDILDSNVNKVITVENLTSFYSLKEDATIIYLAGFHNHTKHRLLMKIYEKYPNAKYYHFGDIDAGGILIYYNLLNKTGIPFEPYKMNLKELTENKNNLKTLTENDKKRLSKMLIDTKYNKFFEVIKYMLDKNVKLEQEILD